MLETGLLVAGAGATGRAVATAAAKAGAPVLLIDKRADVADPEVAGVDFLPRRALVDVVLSPDGGVAGALVADPDAWRVDVVRAKSVVLATGGASALWPSPRAAHETADGLAIAHRAGADVQGIRAVIEGDHTDLEGGVSTGSAGRTMVDGLWVVGRTSAQRAPAVDAARAIVGTLPKAVRPFGDYAVMPNVDSPLPPGFADVKLQRLQQTMGTHFGPGGPHDTKRGLLLLHQLKGEADEYARARPDPELLSFKNACEVAVLLARRRS